VSLEEPKTQREQTRRVFEHQDGKASREGGEGGVAPLVLWRAKGVRLEAG